MAAEVTPENYQKALRNIDAMRFGQGYRVSAPEIDDAMRHIKDENFLHLGGIDLEWSNNYTLVRKIKISTFVHN